MNTLQKNMIKKQIVNAGVRSFGNNGCLFVFHEVAIPDELKKYQTQQVANSKSKKL